MRSSLCQLFTLVLLLGIAPQLLALDCSSPPAGFGNTWWSQYASWCSSCGGTPDISTTSCTPGSNWGGGNDASPPGSSGMYKTGDFQTDFTLYMMEQTLPVFFEAIGNEMACQIDPNCPRKIRQRQIEEQQRLQREARQRAAEADRRRQELERQARFEQTKHNLLGEMRLQPGSGDLQPRNLGLETREVAGTLQARPLVPRDLASAQTLGSAALRSPLAQASCGAFLLNKSDQAARRGDFQEAAFLSNEAAALIGGEKITSAVVCPPPPEVPEIGPGVAAEVSRQKTLEIEAALKKRSRFVRSMYQRVVEQGSQYQAVTENVRLAQERKQQAEKQLEQARQEKLTLEAQLRHAPAPTTEPVNDAESPVTPTTESAMAAAMAALEAAEKSLGEADTDLQKGLDNQVKLEEQMQQTRSLFDTVKQDETKLDQALETLASKEGTQ